jgi:HEAT repeat protein
MVCLFVPVRSQAQQQSLFELVEQFKTTKVFWQQFEVAKRIVELHDLSVLPLLKPWLTDDDRHLRGNVAFVFASLGDESGFDVIAAMLGDKSDRPDRAAAGCATRQEL